MTPNKNPLIKTALIIIVLVVLLAGAYLAFRIFYHPKTNYDGYDTAPIDHALFDKVLAEFVTDSGWVDYQALKENPEALNNYLNLLKNNHPSMDWSREEKLAYWINAYNAFTLDIVIRNYPLQSIKDIRRWSIPFVNTVWDIPFIEIEGETYSLNHLEHHILRVEFDEPRIHFAINCASVSCPPLRKEVFVADRLDSQLEEQAVLFINDPSRNRILSDRVELSSIFSWFKGDFTKEGSLINYVRRYSEIQPSDDARLSYLDYDWALNGIENQNDN